MNVAVGQQHDGQKETDQGPDVGESGLDVGTDHQQTVVEDVVARAGR